jgi:hypothetical protein
VERWRCEVRFLFLLFLLFSFALLGGTDDDVSTTQVDLKECLDRRLVAVSCSVCSRVWVFSSVGASLFSFLPLSLSILTLLVLLSRLFAEQNKPISPLVCSPFLPLLSRTCPDLYFLRSFPKSALSSPLPLSNIVLTLLAITAIRPTTSIATQLDLFPFLHPLRTLHALLVLSSYSPATLLTSYTHSTPSTAVFCS